MSNKTYHDLVGRFNQILNGDKAHDLDNRKEKKMNKELEQAIAEIESNKEKELIKGYKVFNPDWTCRGFQFEVGEIFEEDFYPHVCYRGFHFCKDLKDCFNYYGFDASYKVAEVVALGAVDYSSEDSKCCTNKIGILHELSWGEVLSLVNTGEANTGKCNAGNHNTGDGNTGNHNTGRDNLGNSNTGDQNKGDHNTGDENSGNWNTGDVNKGDFNTGSRNSGNRNTGRGNEGDFNTGHNNASHHNTGDEILVIVTKVVSTLAMGISATVIPVITILAIIIPAITILATVIPVISISVTILQDASIPKNRLFTCSISPHRGHMMTGKRAKQL